MRYNYEKPLYLWFGKYNIKTNPKAPCLEQLPFCDFYYLDWMAREFTKNDELISRSRILIEICNNLPIVGKCKFCKGESKQIAKHICYYYSALSSRKQEVLNPAAACSECASFYEDRGRQKHKSIKIGFEIFIRANGLIAFYYKSDLENFYKELRYCFGVPSKLTAAAALKYFKEKGGD